MLRQQQAKLDQLAQMEAAVKAAEEQHSAGPSRLVPYEDPEDESTIQVMKKRGLHLHPRLF